MFYGFGRGFGFRGASPPWPHVGRGRGGLPRCWHPGTFTTPPYAPSSVPYPAYGDAWAPSFYGGYHARGTTAYPPQVTREQELDLLKEESSALRRQMKEVDTRIKELEDKGD